MRIRTSVVALAAALVLPLPRPGVAGAQDGPPRFSVTEGHLLAYINESDASPSLVGTLQHFSTFRYGSNFFFADVSGGPDLEVADSDLGVYLEYSPVLSLNRVGLVPAGPVLRDVGVTAQLNGGWTPGGVPIDRVFLEGVELAWSVPGFAVFNTQLLARQEQGYHGSWQGTWVYALPFRIGPAAAEINGFLDVWRRTGNGPASTVLVAQPQVRFTLGSPEPSESFVQLGVEFEPSHDFPVQAVRPGWNFAVSPVVRWVF